MPQDLFANFQEYPRPDPTSLRPSSTPVEQQTRHSFFRAVSFDDFLRDSEKKKTRKISAEELVGDLRGLRISREVPDIPVTGRDGIRPDERPKTPPARSSSVIPFDHDTSSSSSLSRPRVVRSCIYWHNMFNQQNTSSSSISSLEPDDVKPNKIRKQD